MFSTLISLIVCAKSLLYYIFLGSFYIGKILFGLILTVVLKSSSLCTNLLAGIQILIEDFGVFIRDLSDHAGFGLCIIYKSIEYIFGIFTWIYNPVASSLQWILHMLINFITWISNSYSNTSAFLRFLLMHMKKLLVLFGSGVWFAVTIVPVAILSSFLLVSYYVGLLVEEIKTINMEFWRSILQVGKNVVEFFWDMPLEAILGLIVLTCLIYLSALYFLPIRHAIINVMRTLRRKIILRLSLLKTLVKSRSLKASTKCESPEVQAVCVICQSKPKNMLILPCKHLCTCQECIEEIRRHSGKCPLCRTYMDKTILIYT